MLSRLSRIRIAGSAADLWVPLLLLASAGLALSIDLPLASWFSNHQLPGDLREILTVVETFGHGIGVALILIAIWTLNPDARRFLPRLIGASLGAGMLANVIKLMVNRQRPRAFHAASTEVLDTFGGLQWFVNAGHGNQSFPSAHSATAVGFAVALSVCFPRGKYLFAVLATLTCVSRMWCEAHYASDVLAGTAVGFVAARFVLRQQGLSAKLPQILPRALAEPRERIQDRQQAA